MAKKKLNMLLYLPLYILVSSIFLFIFSGNSYAMTSNDVLTFFNSVKNVEIYQQFTPSASDITNLISSNYNLSNFNSITCGYRPSNSSNIIVMLDDIPSKSAYSGNIYADSNLALNCSSVIFSIFPNLTLTQTGTKSYSANNNNAISTGFTFQNNLNICTNYTFTTKSSSYIYNNFEILNSISLQSTSLSKFSYSDFNQCVVTITGDWTLADFVFYVERYINDEWVEYKPPHENYVIYGYENPWYITWNDINYWSVGTYRYVADFGSLGTDLFYSESFQITNSIVDNPTTGTINNGDIDINIDTGQTLDNIKDFLGQDPTVTENQFAESFPTVEVDDPTEDFFTWFFTQIQSCFTVNTAQYLTFTLYNKQFRINSDDYILDIPVLNNILGVGCSIFLFYGIFLDIRKEIEKVKEGKFSEIGKEDISASMM